MSSTEGLLDWKFGTLVLQIYNKFIEFTVHIEEYNKLNQNNKFHYQRAPNITFRSIKWSKYDDGTGEICLRLLLIFIYLFFIF